MCSVCLVFVYCVGVGYLWYVYMIYMQCVCGGCVVPGLFVCSVHGVCVMWFWVVMWVECGLSMVCACSVCVYVCVCLLCLHVVPVWCVGGRCMVCIVYCGLHMVCMLCHLFFLLSKCECLAYIWRVLLGDLCVLGTCL